MALVGDYDASTFDENDTDTWPPLPAGVDLYQPTMRWNVTVGGTVQGQTVVAGDQLFATLGAGRLYGDGTYGERFYGDRSDGGWTVDQVYFLAWDSTPAPPDLVPYPNAGCPFTRDDTVGGNWAPGWRIVIDAFYNASSGSRVYGDDDYGDGVYGDEDEGAPEWIDITSPVWRVECGDGTAEGIARVPVAEVVISLYDDDGAVFDFTEPEMWFQPQPGTPIRVGLIGPDYAYHPVVVASLERIEDAHGVSSDGGRVIAVRGFGMVTDLVVDVPGVQRGAELASARYAALVEMTGWDWDSGALTFPPDDIDLIADPVPRDIVVRDELDRTVQSAGWFLDTDRQGRMRVRQWPHEPDGDLIRVADCALPDDVPGTCVAPVIMYANDLGELLNHVVTTNTADPPDEAVADYAESVARYKPKGRAFGFPRTGMAWADPADAQVWAERVADRLGFITRRVDWFEADTLVDPGWLPVLADIDTGRPVNIDRRSIRPLALDAVVVGWRHVITPGKWTSTVFTTTTTTTI